MTLPRASAVSRGRTLLAFAVLALGMTAGLAGCAGPTRGDGGGESDRLATARTAYERGHYGRAYRDAMALVGTHAGGEGQAAYLAGLAARRQDQLDEARRLLRRAVNLGGSALAANAKAELGLILADQGRHGRAARLLEAVADAKTGLGRARALFYAGIAWQKLGQWDKARENFKLAQSADTAGRLEQKINRQLSVTGYTIQIGAFRKPANARRAARRWRDRAQAQGLAQPRLVQSRGTGGESLTLVHLGRFDRFTAARRAQRALSDSDAFVVPVTR